MKEPRVGLGELVEIRAFDVLLVANAALCDAIDQHIDGRLQVHDQIRLGRIHDHAFVHTFIERIFGIVQRDARKQPILLQQVIRDTHGAEQVLLANLLQLAGALKQKE